MSMTYTKSGTFGWAGGGKAGAIVDLWAVSRFSGLPTENQAPPAGAPDAGPVTTGPEFGSPGAFFIADIPLVQDYYIRIQYAGLTYWGFCAAGSLGGVGPGATLEADVIDLGTDGTAVIARGNDSNGNPQIVLSTFGTNPTSVTLDLNGFRPSAQGSPPLPLGTAASPWSSLAVNTLTRLPTAPDGSPVASEAYVNAQIAAAITGTPTAPGAPTLTSATPTSNQVVLDWTAPSNDGGSSVVAYVVMRGTTSSGETTLTILGNVLTYTDTTAVNGTTYYYEVVAVNAIGNSSPSNELSATPLAATTVPGAPTLTSAVASSSQVVLNWTAPSNNGGSAITGYTIRRGTTSGGETTLTTVGVVLTYTDSTAVNGTTYYYEVEATNTIGTGSASNELSASPISGGMNAPSGFTTANQIFEDNFSGTSIDSTKWTVGIGQSSLWQNNGNLPNPYSGANMPGAASVALYNPSQVSVASSVATFTAQPYSGTYAGQGYQWLSGALTSLQKFVIPSHWSQWYVQVNCKMPDTSAGMWPAIWFLGPGSAQELDMVEGGWQANQTSHNWPPNTQLHYDLFASSGQIQNLFQMPGAVGINAGYHIYGMHVVPGVSVTWFIDNTQVAQITTTAFSAQNYTMLMTLQVAASSTNGWHTTGGSTTQTWEIDEVQVYAK
jgi:fibronectin type III domain protein